MIYCRVCEVYPANFFTHPCFVELAVAAKERATTRLGLVRKESHVSR